MTPCSETNSNTWANVSFLIYNITGISQIALPVKVIGCCSSCPRMFSHLQQQGRNYLKLPERFQRRQRGESQKGGCS